jgi:hypothetical protein
MKFNNIKNIVEDNIEVYKDNTGYKIEGVNNSSAQSRDFGSKIVSATKVNKNVAPTLKQTSIAVMKYLKSRKELNLLDPKDETEPDIVPQANGDVKVKPDNGEAFIVRFIDYKKFL